MRFNLSKLNDARVLDQRDYNNLVEFVSELVNEVVNLKRQLLLLNNSAPAGSNSFLAIIDGSSSDGDNKWKYTWTEVIKNGTGYTAGSFADRSGGRTGTAENGLYARNLKEYKNAATGTLGNGVAIANLVGTFALKPCPTNNIVRMYTIVCTDGTVEYWFDDTFEVDGECD
jgi:hypothetical protein